MLDTSNPIADAPPENGVLKLFTTLESSLMEKLQKAVPSAKFVKVFNTVGNMVMVNPSFPGGWATMFICENNDEAKQEVISILDKFGWIWAGLRQRVLLNRLCALVHSRFFDKSVTHAFRLVKL